jgi:DNA-binding beta-propeller fold protein YncE
MARTTPTNGSAIAVAPNDSVAVAANRTAHSVSVFNLGMVGGSFAATRSTIVPIPNSEPWAAVVDNDNTTAYVVLRRTQEVAKITNLNGTPTLGLRVRVGSEPTGIAISPTGRRIYVSNWGEGTVTELDPSSMTITRTIDLNAALAGTNYLGTVAARPGIAHPRALVVTNNGNTSDDDETVYVTEFFSQARLMNVPTDDTAFDVGRQGVIYRFNAGTGAVGPVITLGPTQDTTFPDSVGSTSETTGGVTGCFPNQLFSAVLDPTANRLYVTGMCESPKGPTGPVLDAMTGAATNVNNFKTQIHPTIYVVDTAANTETAAQRVTLTREWQRYYTMPPAPITPFADNAARRFPLIPVDMTFVPRSHVGYVAAYGSDAVFRVQFNDDGTLREVASPAAPFINLNPGGTIPAGRLPVGVAIANGGSNMLALNANTRNVSVVQLSMQSVISATESAPAPTGTEADVNDGQRFFVTGLGRWSLRGQGWNSCEACHPDGLTDNVTWFFARGPRQTTSLDASFDPSGANQRIFNWTAIFDEVHDFELNTRGNSGGVGAIVHANSTPPAAGDRIHFDGTTPVPAGQMPTTTPQAGLSGSTRQLQPDGTVTPRSVLDDWNDIEAYMKTIRSPRAPNSLNATDVAAGRNLFVNNGCAGCHGGSLWTISRRFFTPNETNNNPTTGRLRTTMYTAPATFLPAGLNPPTAGAGRTAALRLTPMDGANDQINCVLRAVGTFPTTLDMMQTGTAPTGVRVREVRANMTAAAQGATGFNPPGLVGMGTGAPFFHAGNARTLEEVFATTFEGHYRALSANFLQSGDRAEQVRQIVAFLLSIDDSRMIVPIPAGNDLCPTTL